METDTLDAVSKNTGLPWVGICFCNLHPDLCAFALARRTHVGIFPTTTCSLAISEKETLRLCFIHLRIHILVILTKHMAVLLAESIQCTLEALISIWRQPQWREEVCRCDDIRFFCATQHGHFSSASYPAVPMRCLSCMGVFWATWIESQTLPIWW